MWMPITGNLTFMHQNTKKCSLHLCALNITGEEAGQIKNMNLNKKAPLISVLIKGGSLFFPDSHPFKLTYLVTHSLFRCSVWVGPYG